MTWSTPFTKVSSGDFDHGDIAWFAGGKLNACYNCVDKHLPHRAEQTAIIWDGDEIGTSRLITYAELAREVSKIANVLKAEGVKKGDVVTLYMPMIPELTMTMLACARIGAIHSVVFAGFSAEALRDRIVDCNSKYVVTADQGLRGGKVIELKKTVDLAMKGCRDIKTCLVVKRTGADVNMTSGRDVYLQDRLLKVTPFIVCLSCRDMYSPLAPSSHQPYPTYDIISPYYTIPLYDL